ncbi:glycoside hydrolase family 97 protein [Opitutaceae bacterium]|nr:glycoside hydrolase family 97 protein [Opitutaceae bacterium]
MNSLPGLLLRLSALFVVSVATAGMPAVKIDSPSGNIRAVVNALPSGLTYNVLFKDQPVVDFSRLGITVDGHDLGLGVTLGTPTITTRDESYVTRGNHIAARNYFNSGKIPVHHHATGRDYTLDFRLYDDGVAYRYIVPGGPVQHVDGESSSWRFYPDAKVWYFERLNPGWKLKSYAGEWMETDIDDLHTATPAKVGPVQGTPLVLELPNSLGYAAITKAALYNYSGMRLEAVGDRTIVANFTEGADGFDVTGTIVTPWRATLLADDLNELVNSDFINNLNPAPDPELFADTSYIKPGRSVWSWETISLGTPADQRRFIDYAADIGFEHSIIDDGWKDWPDPWETITNLCAHGQSKGIGVWLWVHSNDIDDPTDDYRQMRDYFDRIAAAGGAGLKIDFMNGETKVLVDFEIAVLRFAAERKLMINFHGCHASTGEERTFPNEMTREGIRGLEVNKMKEGPLPASHNAALPFTRFVTGHADYTPILFTNPGPTTWAHQVATLVTFLSPLQVFCEDPGTMMNDPVLKTALPVMQAIPTLWDETVVLTGSAIGDLTAMARRDGKRWFVGILNGGQARDYELALSFLPPGEYQATAVRDDPTADRINLVGRNPKADLKEFTTAMPFKVVKSQLIPSDTLSVSLATGGGYVLMLEPR